MAAIPHNGYFLQTVWVNNNNKLNKQNKNKK